MCPPIPHFAWSNKRSIDGEQFPGPVNSTQINPLLLGQARAISPHIFFPPSLFSSHEVSLCSPTIFTNSFFGYRFSLGRGTLLPIGPTHTTWDAERVIHAHYRNSHKPYIGQCVSCLVSASRNGTKIFTVGCISYRRRYPDLYVRLEPQLMNTTQRLL